MNKLSTYQKTIFVRQADIGKLDHVNNHNVAYKKQLKIHQNAYITKKVMIMLKVHCGVAWFGYMMKVKSCCRSQQTMVLR